MTARTQTKAIIINTMQAALAANSDLTDLLGDGATSIYQYQDEDQLKQALRNNPQAVSPALIISSDGSLWVNDGATHDRNITFTIYVLIYDPVGYLARLAAANGVMEIIYETLIQNALGLDNPVINPLQPIADAYWQDIESEKGKPIEISVWKTDFSTIVSWFKQ